MMPEVELIFSPDCPNIGTVRHRLRVAFRQLGIAPRWTEWDQTSSEAPAYTREYASPTVLIGGRDIATAVRSHRASACRLYEQPAGNLMGAPSVESLLAALGELWRR